MGYDVRASAVVQLLQLLIIMFNLMAESVCMSDINNFHMYFIALNLTVVQ